MPVAHPPALQGIDQPVSLHQSIESLQEQVKHLEGILSSLEQKSVQDGVERMRLVGQSVSASSLRHPEYEEQKENVDLNGDDEEDLLESLLRANDDLVSDTLVPAAISHDTHLVPSAQTRVQKQMDLTLTDEQRQTLHANLALQESLTNVQDLKAGNPVLVSTEPLTHRRNLSGTYQSFSCSYPFELSFEFTTPMHVTNVSATNLPSLAARSTITSLSVRCPTVPRLSAIIPQIEYERNIPSFFKALRALTRIQKAAHLVAEHVQDHHQALEMQADVQNACVIIRPISSEAPVINLIWDLNHNVTLGIAGLPTRLPPDAKKLLEELADRFRSMIGNGWPVTNALDVILKAFFG